MKYFIMEDNIVTLVHTTGELPKALRGVAIAITEENWEHETVVRDLDTYPDVIETREPKKYRYPIWNEETGMVEENYEAIEIEDSIAASKAEKEAKEIAINSMVISLNNVEYDAHDQGLLNMTAVATVANFKFIQALVSIQPELSTLYDAVYKTQIPWKNYSNGVSQVQVESIEEAIEIVMLERAKKYGAKK